MEPILTIDNLNSFGGNMLRQGDKSQLKYRLRDVGNKNLGISSKSCEIKMYGRNYTTVVYETTTTVSSDDTVSFTIDKVLPKGTFYLEFTVGSYIFPTDHREFFEITPSGKGIEANVIEIVGVDAVVRKAVDLINDDPSLIIDEDKLVTDIISNTGIGNINEYYKAFNDLKPKAEQSITKSAEALTKSQNALNVANGIDAKATNALSLSESADTLSKSVQEQFNQVIIDGDSSVEAAQARVDASGQTNPTLKARLDKEHNEVTTQLAHTAQTVKPYNYIDYGIAFNSNDPSLTVKDTHASWSHGNVDYDQSTDEFIVFYNVKPSHTLDNNRVLMRKKQPNGSFSNPLIVADKMSEGVSCKTQSSGIAKNGDYISMVYEFTGSNNGLNVYRSSNKGVTWASKRVLINGNPVMAFNGDVTGFLRLESGRIIVLVKLSANSSATIYSDDNGDTWKYSNAELGGATEPAWCELSDGSIVAYLRANVDNDYEVKKPVKISHSEDGGITWSAPVNSTVITDYTNSNGHLIKHKESKRVEFIHHSRYVQPDGLSSVYVSVGSEDDLKNDRMGEQVRIGRLSPHSQTINQMKYDNGYIGAAKSKDNTILVTYYNGTHENSQICYMEGKPTHTNSFNPPINPYNGTQLGEPTKLYEYGLEKAFDLGTLSQAFATGDTTLMSKESDHLKLETTSTTFSVLKGYKASKSLTRTNKGKLKCKVNISGLTGSMGFSLRLYNKQNPTSAVDGRVSMIEIKENGDHIMELNMPVGATELYPMVVLGRLNDGLSSSITAKVYEIWAE